MATQWGRRETIIWPPHVPILSYTAIATALLCTCLFVWQRLTFSLTPLQRSYISEYIRSGVGRHLQCSPVIPALVSGRGKASPAPGLPGGFCRWDNDTSERHSYPRCYFRLGNNRGLSKALSRAETKVGRHFAAPDAPARGVRRQGIADSLRRQLPRGGSQPRCYALVRRSV